MQISVPAGGNGAVATSIVGASVLSIILTVVGLLAGVIGPMTGLTLLGSALAVITVVDRECRAVLLQGLGVPPRVVLRLN
jgi:hypothetical protein